jgi:hypothetical protein
MATFFKSAVITLLTLIALINGLVAYNFYTHSLKPCNADNLLIYSDSTEKVPALLQDAQRDIHLIMSGKAPLVAKLTAGASDGGSEFYEAKDYEIFRWHSMTSIDNVEGYMLGYTLRIKGNAPKEYSHTWFQVRS